MFVGMQSWSKRPPVGTPAPRGKGVLVAFSFMRSWTRLVRLVCTGSPGTKFNSDRLQDCAVIHGQLRGCFAANCAEEDLISRTMIPENHDVSPEKKSDAWSWPASRILSLVPQARSPRQALESSMRRDTLGPVTEAGVRHRKYARLSLARTRVISCKTLWILHRELPRGCLAFTIQGGP